jgi:hypothetical protein
LKCWDVCQHLQEAQNNYQPHELMDVLGCISWDESLVLEVLRNDFNKIRGFIVDKTSVKQYVLKMGPKRKTCNSINAWEDSFDKKPAAKKTNKKK